MGIWQILVAVGVPSATVATVIGIMFRRIEQRLEDEKQARRKFERFQLSGLTATMALSEANAIALQNGKCNGETHKALEYMKDVKREQREFLISEGINHIF